MDSPKVEEISIDDMLAVVRRALTRDGQLPCTVVVLDEVQQFINNSPDIAHDVQEVVEALSKELDGRVLVVALASLHSPTRPPCSASWGASQPRSI